MSGYHPLFLKGGILKGISLSAASIAVAVLASALTVTASASASATAAAPTRAAACNLNHAHRDIDTKSVMTQGSSTALRPGPYADCTPYVSLPAGVVFDYHCSTVNSVKNVWTYGEAHYSGRIQPGWIYNPNLPDGGSKKLC
ncbi:SH3 domain-containing protein [Streptomyces sp. NPDC052051]|uniref:SH3 domain-containing protein n=1 Tax=Streptomyces sp. NPDC052051 TaxID=3154649 RepID=UPI00341B82C0